MERLTARFRRVLTAAAVLAFALAVLAHGAYPEEAAAATDVFTSVSVSPTRGTTTTTFVFSATYSGSNGALNGAASVRARAGALTVQLTRRSGNANQGTWQAPPRTLPIGTRTFIFEALNKQGTVIASRSFGPVTVTALPTPTPSPTPKPTPKPTSRPTVAPTSRPTATPGTTAGATPTSAATGTPGSSASPPSTPTAIGGATETSPSPSGAAVGGTATERNGSLLLAALLGVLVIVGVGGIALLAGRRRAEEEPADGRPLTPGPASVSAAPAPVLVDEQATAAFTARLASAEPPSAEPPQQPPGAWDAYADIDDRPIGTVDELPPGDYQRRPN